ncbi:hypothetical protein P885DRAFT_37899 [Corynascus similis CBS 632.67]
MVALIRSLAFLGWLLAGAAAAATPTTHELFAAVETGAILSPRVYPISPANPLVKREDNCEADHHPCHGIGPAGEGFCCPNDQYCIVDPDNISKAACCHIGAKCPGVRCATTQYLCRTTATITTSGTTTTSLGTACCPRACTGTSQFQCPTSLGGWCCQYGQRCARGDGNGGEGGGDCLFTVSAPTPTPSTTIDPALIPPPPGCETGQTSCPATMGGGCCAATQACVLYEGRVHCTEREPPLPTGSGVSVVGVENSGGLSAGATAGVAIGVVVGAGAIAGALGWWWCAARKRRRRDTENEGMGDGVTGSVASRPTGVVGRVLGGGGSSTVGSPGGGRADMMSEATSDAMSRSGRFSSGITQDYFGPAPAFGPYSETHPESGVTTPGLDRGGVPLQPHEPGDIAVPVEIDSRLRNDADEPPAGLVVTPRTQAPPESGEVQERYELYGSEVGSPTLPSPYVGGMPSPDERPR